MLYRAIECSKRATSPERVDPSVVNIGGKVSQSGSPETVMPMPVPETDKSQMVSTQRGFKEFNHVTVY